MYRGELEQTQSATKAPSLLLRFVDSKKGSIAVMYALVVPVLIGFLALGVEVGFLYFKHRQLQTAADVASYAGTVALRAGETQTVARNIARDEAIANGFDPATGTLIANVPPQSGAYTNNRSMEVLIQDNIPRSFSAIYSRTPHTASLRGVATYDNGGTGCIIALNPSAGGAVTFTGTSNSSLIACEVMSNSVAEDSVLVQGSADVDAPCVNAVGGVEHTSNLTMTDCPEARENMPPLDDPYSYLTDPPEVAEACQPNGSTAPGRHCNGLTLSGTLNLAPGTYAIDGGTLRANAGADITGTDITFFIYNNADVRFNGAAQLDLTAPTTGPYAGVLMYGDEASTGSDIKLNGTANSSFTGAFYMPGQTVEHLGDFGATNGCTQIVADQVVIAGNAAFGANCTGAGVQQPVIPGMVRLVE